MKQKADKAALRKYVDLAKSLKMISAKIISPRDIVFDIRALLKCRWDCEYSAADNLRCGIRDTTYRERVEMIKRYKHILMVHSHDTRKLSAVALEIERRAFLDGHYFAFAIRCCNLCKNCVVKKGKACPTPERVRPCDSSFGIDIYKTARRLGMSCEVLQNKNAVQNRYGFVLID